MDVAAQTRRDEVTREACIALARARTERTAAILRDQWLGALREETEQIGKMLAAGHLELADGRLDRLLSRATIGLHLTEPFHVVLCGRPNVGKSSLINALLGFERAIVFDQPGTTRDVVTAHTAIDGWPVELADTAGFRDSDDGVERAGRQKAQQRLDEADLVVLVFDAGETWDDEDERLLRKWPRALPVANKCDVISPSTPAHPLLKTSVLSGEGIDTLTRSIASRLVEDPPSAGEGIPFTSRQVAILRQAASLVSHEEIGLTIQVLRQL
jgi:tRNA modification GTPase